jgi:hypothetical protein
MDEYIFTASDDLLFTKMLTNRLTGNKNKPTYAIAMIVKQGNEINVTKNNL